MLKTTTRIKTPLLIMAGILALVANNLAAAAQLTESSCKKAKLTLAEARSVCLLEAQKASPSLTLSPDAKAKCEAAFDAGLNSLKPLIIKAGVACRFIKNADSSVQDLDTLLLWSGLVNGNGIPDLKTPRDRDNLYTRLEFDSVFLAGLNQAQGATCTPTTPLTCIKAGFQGKQYWRGPTIGELSSLYGCELKPGGLCAGLVDPGSGEFASQVGVWSVSGDTSVSGDAYVVLIDPGNIGFISVVDPGGVDFNALAVIGGRDLAILQ
jgi:hypothetical protein